MVAAIGSCTVYSDRDVTEDPYLESYEYLQRNILSSVFRTIEIADFFNRYLEIKEDRGAALVLGKLYFGDYFNGDNLVYEGYEGGFWGSIKPATEPGRYLVTPYYSAPEGIIYNVEITPERRFIIHTKPQTKDLPLDYWIEETVFEVECTASIRENYIIIESLSLEYTEDTGMETMARITSTNDPAMIHLCSEGSYEIQPFSGVLEVEIENGMFHNKFHVKYYNGKYEITL